MNRNPEHSNTQHEFLGTVPFPSDISLLKQGNVKGSFGRPGHFYADDWYGDLVQDVKRQFTGCQNVQLCIYISCIRKAARALRVLVSSLLICYTSFENILNYQLFGITCSLLLKKNLIALSPISSPRCYLKYRLVC